MSPRSDLPLTSAHWRKPGVREGYKGIAEFLIAKGADINLKDRDGRTPLGIAVHRGHTEIAALLRRHGAKE
jgi:ankyrin repeat protein